MASETRGATAVRVDEGPITLFQLAYAIVLVGAGLLAAAAFIHGLELSSTSGRLAWALIGLVCYLAAWAWGILLAQS